MSDCEYDPVTELRASWCDILEELVECPVCLEIPKDSIYQCIRGHDVCKLCKKLLDKCPVCKEPINGARNWTLEKIVAKFEDIKLSLMEPENAINNIVKSNKRSVTTQTKETGGAPVLRRSSRTNVLAKAKQKAENEKKNGN